MIKMAKTLRNHTAGILAYADHPITSGKLEGINNKIKTLTKRSYGFHDQNFFILKFDTFQTFRKFFQFKFKV